MSRRFSPDIIIYSKKGKIYNALGSVGLILGLLSFIAAIILDCFNKKAEFTFFIFLAICILVLSLIFDIKSSKYSTVMFL